MGYTLSKLWKYPVDNLDREIDRCLEDALTSANVRERIPVYFRADDIAVPGRQFKEMIALFSRHSVPLSLAVVPSWLTQARWASIESLCCDSSDLWCFHQHGWRHKNHETSGKKQEFGPSRSRLEIQNDLFRGRERLAHLMRTYFFPAFTPPWNRCSHETLRELKKAGYKALSRSQGASPPTPDGLMDVQVNVDLHTRKETTTSQGWQHLYAELTAAVKGGFCGIMIHHQRMNDNALDFMDHLLRQMKHTDAFGFYHLKTLSQGGSFL